MIYRPKEVYTKITWKITLKNNHILDIHYKIPDIEYGYGRTKNYLLEGKESKWSRYQSLRHGILHHIYYVIVE